MIKTSLPYSRLRARLHHLHVALSLAAFIATSGAFAQSSDIAVSVTDDSGRGVEDAVVVAVPVEASARTAPSPKPDALDQIDKEFVPKVKVVVVGTPVTFPNKDAVRHHVYSFSGAKQFELPLYAGVPARPVVFDKPGIVVLGCNIHDWMVGHIYVSESPWFAKTGRDGKAVISGLSSQAYFVRVWHPQMEEAEDLTRKKIDLGKVRHGEAAWAVKLKPEVRVRRAPAAVHGAHY
jgi:plastocyanin